MPEDPSGEEWLTVSAASKVLGISDRQTRRWAGRLADVDRKSDGRGGRLVRLSALLSLRESDASPDAGHDRGPEASRTDEDAPRTSERNDLIEQLQARLQERGEEIEYLRGALQREQAIAMTATSDASELRRKLETLTDGLIEAKARVPDVGKETSQDRPEPATESRKETETAGFWGRLRGLFGGGER